MPKSMKFRIAAILPPLLIALVGCGFQAGTPASGNGIFAITPSTTAISTNGQVQFKAVGGSGAPVAVNWTVASGENAASLGEGTIQAVGLYRPPSVLSRDSVQVKITASLQSDPGITASSEITITPGFVQALLPENATLTPGATLQVSGEIAEVDAGAVHWSVGATGAGGTLSPSNCRRGARQYTTCTVSYTAPATLSGPASIYITGTVNHSAANGSTSALHVLLNRNGLNSSPLANQAEQTSQVEMGSSGGNDNDYDTFQDKSGNPLIADCCGGTLGALVKDANGNEYILSNNHVLAESDQGKIGDTIIQPGLIDDACRPLDQPGSTVRAVGTLKAYLPLATSSTNVDAALAAVTPGAVDPTGSILGLGAAGTGANGSIGAAPPMAGTGEALTAANLDGLKVAKSGRTTGLTCSTVAAVDLAVEIDYYKDCAESQPYTTKLFTDQIGIAGNSFSDSGDSGALVVDAANAEPVGLYYAGGTDNEGHGLSVANPIKDVLSGLGAQIGSQLSIVGTATPHPVSCVDYDGNTRNPTADRRSTAARAKATAAVESAEALLLNRESGILGVTAGQSADSQGDPAVVIYIDKTKPATRTVPQTIDGVRTVVIATDAASVARGTAAKLPQPLTGIHLPASVLQAAEAVQKQQARRLMADPAIFGVGVTQSEDNPAEAALLVLTDLDKSPQQMPATVGGLRVRYLRLHRFHVTRSKYAPASRPLSSCALKTMRASTDWRSTKALQASDFNHFH